MFKLYRKIRYRKGFGVHSPFVYNLITKVVEEKTSYYAFEEIENFRQRLLSEPEKLSSITAQETQSARYGAFLFRIVHFFKCENVVQIGSSTGVMGLYLAMASPSRSNCYLLEERKGFNSPLLEFARMHHLNKLHSIEGDYREELEKLHLVLPEVDLLFVNQLPKTIEIEELIRLCTPLINRKSILILNGIAKDKIMRNFWQSMKKHSQSRIMMDLHGLGLIFFNDKLPKQYYKAYFNYGKKQNLHKNWRRRLHIPGRWEKGSQNPFTH